MKRASRSAGALGSALSLLVMPASLENVTAQANITAEITADNAYSFGWGDRDGIQPKNFFPGVINTLAPQITGCRPSTSAPNVPVAGAEYYPGLQPTLTDFLYIIAWSDDRARQGVLGTFTDATTQTTVSTGAPGWEVFATGIDKDDDFPSLADINKQITLSNGVNGPQATSSVGWVGLTGGATGKEVGQLVVDGTATAGSLCGAAKWFGLNPPRWMWYSDTTATIDAFTLQPMPYDGLGWREFLIFRLPVWRFYFDSTVDLAITKRAVGTGWRPGQQGQFFLNPRVVSGTATGAFTVHDQLPSGLVLVSATSSAFNCSPQSGNAFTCTYTGTLPLSAPASPPPILVVVNVTGPPGNHGLNCAEVRPAPRQLDSIQANNTGCVRTPMGPPESPPEECCDQLKVRPYIGGPAGMETKTFTVTNLKVPASPICSIEIQWEPSAPGSYLGGGPANPGIVVDGGYEPSAWSLFGPPYTRIPNTGAISAKSSVSFNLSVGYLPAWSGRVRLVVRHCDGTVCELEYGPWTPRQPTSAGDGTHGPIIHFNPGDWSTPQFPSVTETKHGSAGIFTPGTFTLSGTSAGNVRWIGLQGGDGMRLLADPGAGDSLRREAEAEQPPGLRRAARLEPLGGAGNAILYEIGGGDGPPGVETSLRVGVLRETARGTATLRWTAWNSTATPLATGTISLDAPPRHVPNTGDGRRVSVEVRGGWAIPAGEQAKDFEAGPALGASVTFQATPTVGIYGGYAWSRFDPKGPQLPPSSGVSLPEIHIRSFEAGVRARLRQGILMPFLQSGLVYRDTRYRTQPCIPTNLGCPPDAGDATSGYQLGFEAGGGAELLLPVLGNQFSLAPMVTYAIVPCREGRPSINPVRPQLAVRFGI